MSLPSELLPLWGFPPGTSIAPADEQGTNNRTFLLRDGPRRYVLRVGGFSEVTAHVGRLEETTRWIAAHEEQFLSVATAANAGS